VQVTLEGIQFAGSVENQHDEHRQGDENEQANTQLAQADVPG
jgi:hypothetical protein